jgi:excinuclease ABC subunit C
MSASARAAAAVLPAGPGVYRFRDARGRALYVGRAVSLRRRVRSYWGDLGDRPHLAAMVAQIDRIEAVSCDSEHEAAWLERNLLERQLPRWNRTAGGQEVAVCIGLDQSARSPGLSVVHADGRSRAPHLQYFGPYLGGARVRLAVAGLLRAYPLDYAGDAPRGASRDFARERGVAGADRPRLALSLAAVLGRDQAAVDCLREQLTQRRTAAAESQAFEVASRIHAELAAIEWITCPQQAAALDGTDADVAGWADGLLVRFEIRDGRLCGWRQYRRSRAQAEPWLARTPRAWQDFAGRSAVLAARLAQGSGAVSRASTAAGRGD